MIDPSPNLETPPKVVPLRVSPAGLVALRDLPERPPVEAWYLGFPEWHRKLALAPGTLSVVSGHPGHGKSSLMGNIWVNTAAAAGLHIVVCTMENHPMPDYRKMLRQFWAGMRQDEMTDDQISQADDFIHDHYRFIIEPRERPTLEFILDHADKTDLDVLQIDPWNRVESQRAKDETETEYVAWCLTELRLYAKRRNCHVQVIAHPAKRDARFRDRTPFLEDISGSKNWDNMPDSGIIVHRKEFWDATTNSRLYDADVYHLKARYEETGYPCCLPIRLNPKTCRFESRPETA